MELQRRVFDLVASLSLLMVLMTECRDPERSRVEAAVRSFYQTSKPYKEADRSLLSQGLLALIDSAALKEQMDAERIRNSDHPTDKPLMIEGDIFTSVYEGHDQFMIDKVSLEKGRAEVDVTFVNTGYQMKWHDRVILLREDGWKIHDVQYHQDSLQGSTRQALASFLAQ